MKCPESYPLQNTFKIIMSEDQLTLLEKYRMKILADRGSHSFTVNIFGTYQLLFTNDERNVKHVLKDNFGNYPKGFHFKTRFQGLLGDGIFNSDGDEWFVHRKVSAGLFSTGRFKTGVLDTMNSHVRRLKEIIKSRSGKNQAFDIQDLMFRFTLDTICQVAFGSDPGALRDPEASIPFADAFDYCQFCIDKSFFQPFLLWWRLFTPSGWEMRRCLTVVEDYARGIVRQKRQQYSTEKGRQLGASKNGADLLSLYIESEMVSTKKNDLNQGRTKTASATSSPLTDTDLRDVIMNFVIAGRDTTAQALSWSIFRMCIHLETQQRVREEVQTILSDPERSASIECQPLTYEELHKMKYLDAFCHEVLRLHPSVPKEAKLAMKADTLPDGSPVAAGDLVVFCPYIMGRSSHIWENPKMFSPERFLDKPKPSPFKFTAFQAGPRTCLGQNLALLEMKCVLANLVSSFQFTLEQPIDSVVHLPTITLPIKNGLKVSTKVL